MRLPLDIFTLIIEELVASTPDLYFPLQECDIQAYDWVSDHHLGRTNTTTATTVTTDHSLTALKSICLACRSLVPFCQRELFASVKFDSWTSAGKKWRLLDKFHRLLQHSPHLSEYVRNVYFSDDSRDYPKSELISSVLLKLCNVRVFDLDKGRYSAGGNWKQFPTKISLAIGHITRLPTLRILRMSYMEFIPPAVIRCAPQLRHLILFSSSFSIDQTTVSAAENQPTASQMTGHSLTQPTGQTSGLETLIVDITPEDDADLVMRVVNMVGKLEHLRWSSYPHMRFVGLSKIFSTGISKTLTTLTLTIGPLTIVPGGEYPSGCCGLHTEIWKIPKQNVLQSLTLVFYYPLEAPFGDLENLHTIDRAMTSDRFPCLSRVRARFVLRQFTTNPRFVLWHDGSAWWIAYESQFPLVASRKGVDFDLSVDFSFGW